MTSERWRAVVGYEGLYEVSDRGRVRGLDRVVKSRLRGTPRVKTVRGLPLSAPLGAQGYPQVSLCRDGKQRNTHVHRMVLEAFVGPAPPGCECCHNNGDRADSRLENLRWDTPVANQFDKLTHGTDNRGEKNGMSRLTADTVFEIRAAVASGETHAEVASRYGIARQTVGDIMNGRRWGHAKRRDADARWVAVAAAGEVSDG